MDIKYDHVAKTRNFVDTLYIKLVFFALNAMIHLSFASLLNPTYVSLSFMMLMTLP